MRFIVKILLSIGLALTAPPLKAEWIEASSKHFVVIGDAPRAQIQQFAEELARFDSAVRKAIGANDLEFSARNRVRIFLVRGDGAVQDLFGPNAGGVGGFYRASPRASIAVVPQLVTGAVSGFDARYVLYHEYVHHLILGTTSGIYPAWVSEGLAELFGNARVNADGSVDLAWANNVRAEEVLYSNYPVRKLLEVSAQKPSERGVFQLYARGWLLAHYLILGDKRDGQFDAYMRLVNQGVPSLKAGEQAFGDLNQLDNELDRYRSGKFRYLPLAASVLTPAPVVMRVLDPAEAAAMPAYTRLLAGRGQNLADIASDASKVAARFPDNAFAQATYASAAQAAKQRDAALAAADRALALDKDQMDAVLVKAQLLLADAATDKDMAKFSAARALIDRASVIDSGYAWPMVLRFDSYRAAGEAPTPAAIAGLRRASKLVPQAREILLKLAEEMIREGNLPDARRALAPLAFDPHAPRDNPAAVLLAMIDDGADAKALQDRVGLLSEDAKKDGKAARE